MTDGSDITDGAGGANDDKTETETSRILIVDADVLVRHPVAEYLRECGYSVVEAHDAAEAKALLGAGPVLSIDILLSRGAVGFELVGWAREAHPELEVILAGSLASVTQKAGELCEEGTAEQLPYEHKFLLEHIRQLTAGRRRQN